MTAPIRSQGFILGTEAQRPNGKTPFGGVQNDAFGLYLATDTGNLYQSTGEGWTLLIQLGAPIYGSGNLSVPGTAAVTGATTLSSLHATGASALDGALSFGATIKSTSASAPAAAAGANAGTSPPAPVVVAGSNDVAGSITFGSGSGSPASGDYVDVTFGAAYPAAPKAVIIIPLNAATMAKAPLAVTALSTTGFSVSMQTAAATSQTNTVYGFYYFVIA